MTTAHSTKRRILVVDDSAVTRRAVSEWLRELGDDVVAENTGHSGLSRIRSHGKKSPVHGVLLDLHMPFCSGGPVLIEIRDKHPGVPVIVMADPDTCDEVRNAMRQGAQDFLVKPLTATLVRHKCRAVLLERDTPD